MECYQDLIICSNKFSLALLTRNRGSSLAPFDIVESKNLGLQTPYYRLVRNFLL